MIERECTKCGYTDKPYMWRLDDQAWREYCPRCSSNQWHDLHVAPETLVGPCPCGRPLANLMPGLQRCDVLVGDAW